MRTRAELGRAEDHYTGSRARSTLEGLERERVGLAPAAARLLRERERFGDGALLGPISDFLTTSANSAVLVERFLGMTVHAVVVRDQAAADAVRAWHTSVNPGPLLLLPLDAAPPSAGGESGDLLQQVEATARVGPGAAPAGTCIRGRRNGVRRRARRGLAACATAGQGPLRAAPSWRRCGPMEATTEGGTRRHRRRRRDAR
jgi:chromosome segregation protein